MKNVILTSLTAATMLLAAASTTAPAVGSPTPPPSPTISPSVTSKPNPAGAHFPSCPTGDLCARVRDYGTGGSRVFYLYSCHTYTVSHWYDIGDLIDNQTGNVTTYIYNQYHQVIDHFQPATNHLRTARWDDAYYIKNC